MADYHYSMTVSDGNYNIRCTELSEGYTGSVGNLTCKYTETNVTLTDKAFRNWLPILDAPATNIEVTDADAGYDEDVLTLSDLVTYFTTILHIPESGGGEGGGGGESVEWGDITGDIDDNADLANALQGKQDTLTAGTGISINDNVISATGGGGSQVQADWSQADSSAPDYIKNKPTLRQPASDGTAGQYLKSAGSGNAPVWETLDTTPTESSAKAITSGGVFTALAGKADASTVRFVIHAEYNVGTGAVTLASTTTQAELMCSGVDPRIRPQAIALANAVITLQNKIIQQTPEYEKAPLTQEVMVGTGEIVLRSNPLVQEYRATVRDYAASMKSLDELLNTKKGTTQVNPLDALRNKIG